MNDRPSARASSDGQRYSTSSQSPEAHGGQGDRRRQRVLGRAIPLAILSAGSFVVGVVVGSSADGSQAVGRFVSAWEQRDFDAMHAELSLAAREGYPLPEFSRLYSEAEATATSTDIAFDDPIEEDGAATLDAIVKTHAFGEVKGSVELPLAEEGKINWAPHLVFPGLDESERLERDTRLSERAPLLAADGSALAEGPATARTSPLGAAATAITGTVGSPSRQEKDDLYALGFPEAAVVGTGGLERAFNAELAGQPSGELFAVGDDGERRTLATGEPTPGDAVKTTIDPDVQSATVAALGDQFGGVATLDAKTGDVRGVAGLAFSAPQPPGSTFKIITAVAGLDAGVVKLEDKFPVETSNTTIGREISNAQDAPCGGTFVQSFAKSCNTVFAPLGVEVGKERLVAAAEAFGFEEVPQLAAPEALEALAPPPSSLGEVESDIALGETAIGQGQVLATPLQMASVAQTIANDGVREPTSLAKTETLRPDAEAVEVTTPETAEKLHGMMLEVVRSGTGTSAQIPEIEVAGKTGTAETGPRALEPGQVLAPGETAPQNENAWFASYAPANKPELAVAVMLIDATGGGGTVAAPIAREIYASVLAD